MFVDKIDQAWRGLFLRKDVEAHETVALAKFIYGMFFSEEAQWEVSITAPERNRLKQIVSTATPNTMLDASLFDKAYDLVVRDMSRSLANFQTTEMWRCFVTHKDTIEELFKGVRTATMRSRVRSPSMESSAAGVANRERSGSTGRARSVSESLSGEDPSSESIDFDHLTKAEVLARVRALYRTTQMVRLVKQLNREIYSCMVGDEIRGIARQEGDSFYFCDVHGKILLNVPVAVVFEKATIGKAAVYEEEAASLAAKHARSKLFRRKSMPEKLVLSYAKEQAAKEVAAAKESTSSASPPPGADGSSRIPIRRSQTASRLKRTESTTKMVAGKHRSFGSPLLARNRQSKAVSFHFKTLGGTVCGPVALADARLLWKYHLLDPTLEASFDSGLNWEKLVELSDPSFGFVPETQVKSIDPTVIVKNF